MSDYQQYSNSEIALTSSETSGLSIDDFKSLYYQFNAKPDTELKILKGQKLLHLADIRSINESIELKLRNHDLVTACVCLTFVLTNGKVRDYSSWQEFEREKWQTENEKISSISMNWDITIKLPNFQLPQRGSIPIMQ